MTITPYDGERSQVALTSYQDAAILRLGEWARSAEAAHTIAGTLVQTSFCPDSFRNKPGEATAAILAGIEVGLQPMAALRSFDVIQGQAAARAMTLRAIVQGAGHEMVLIESTTARCKMKGRRRGSSEWQNVTWDMDRARQLGLVNKSNWKSQPTAMLLARATSELARLIAADAILGIPYSVEELADGGVFDQQVAADTGSPANGTAPGKRRMSRPQAVESPAPPAGEGEASESEPDDGMVTPAQLRNIGRLMGKTGLDITDRAKALGYVASKVGRPIESRKDLSRQEASLLIDELEADVKTSGAGPGEHTPAEPASPPAGESPAPEPGGAS